MRLSALRNLGPATERRLIEADIPDAAALRDLGAVAAWRRLRFRHGAEVSLNALCAPGATLEDRDWRSLGAEQRRALRAAAESGTGSGTGTATG